MQDAQSVHWPAHQSLNNDQMEEAEMLWPDYMNEWSHQNSPLGDSGFEEKEW